MTYVEAGPGSYLSLSGGEQDPDWKAYLRRRKKLAAYRKSGELHFNPRIAECAADLCLCQNCGQKSRRDELFEIEDVWERVEYPIGHPLCVVPSGECPNCGSLAYDVRVLEEIR